jgi:hypothetical protein
MRWAASSTDHTAEWTSLTFLVFRSKLYKEGNHEKHARYFFFSLIRSPDRFRRISNDRN